MTHRRHPPSPRKLHRAWSTGNVALSSTLVRGVSLCVALLLLPGMLAALAGSMGQALRQAIISNAFAFEPREWIVELVILTFPLLLACAIASTATGMVQTRGRITPKRLAADPSRLELGAGLRRIVSKERWSALLHAQATSLAIVVVLVGLLLGAFQPLANLIQDPQAIASVAATLVRKLTWSVALLGLLLAVADLVIVRAQWLKALWMTDLELMRERQDAEGDAAVRAEQRRLHRQPAFDPSGISASVPTLLISDGCDWLFGLRYVEDVDEIPVLVVAERGDVAQLWALGIAEAQVPRFVDGILAKSLKGLRPGQRIPAVAYDRTAELLAQARLLSGG